MSTMRQPRCGGARFGSETGAVTPYRSEEMLGLALRCGVNFLGRLCGCSCCSLNDYIGGLDQNLPKKAPNPATQHCPHDRTSKSADDGNRDSKGTDLGAADPAYDQASDSS